MRLRYSDRTHFPIYEAMQSLQEDNISFAAGMNCAPVITIRLKGECVAHVHVRHIRLISRGQLLLCGIAA